MNTLGPLVIVGCGGHAKACSEVAGSLEREVLFIVGVPGCSSEILGIPVLQEAEALAQLPKLGVDEIFVALGDNSLRRKVTDKWEKLGFKITTLVSPSASLSPSAMIGKGVVLMPHSSAGASTVIGPGVIINTGAIIEHDSRVGEFSHIGPGSILAGGVFVGDEVLVGAGTVAIPRVVIEGGITVGAGSTVVADLLNAGTYVGSPARLI